MGQEGVLGHILYSVLIAQFTPLHSCYALQLKHRSEEALRNSLIRTFTAYIYSVALLFSFKLYSADLIPRGDGARDPPKLVALTFRRAPARFECRQIWRLDQQPAVLSPSPRGEIFLVSSTSTKTPFFVRLTSLRVCVTPSEYLGLHSGVHVPAGLLHTDRLCSC